MATNNFSNKLKVLPQYIIPQHFLSSLMYKITRSENPLLKNLLIKSVVKLYNVNVDEAVIADVAQYHSFNQFFTRAINPDKRPIDTTPNSITCPVDGTVSQAGVIDQDQIFQAKNHNYSLSTLLANDDSVSDFINGSFATIYLSPRDYHRIHCPISGTLKKMIYVPGKLYSVNQATTEEVPGLFAKNERVICLFETIVGPVAVILVGAIFVSSMDTVWAGSITPSDLNKVTYWDYENRYYEMNKADELGRFNMGSTVILLFPQNTVSWSDRLTVNNPVQLGQKIATISGKD